MADKYIIKDTRIVNEGKTIEGDLYINEGRIEKFGGQLSAPPNTREINGHGKVLIPGVIDDQVHFREPGLTHKATIYSEAKAAVAGGTTSFMEMPNTLPPALTLDLLEEKYALAKQHSLANYSFYLGASNHNVEQILKANKHKNNICGIKIFMGSSTGNLLVNNPLSLDRIFSESEMLIATHCEEEAIIKQNYQQLKAEKGTLLPSDHPLIRSAEACFESSFKAIQYASKHNSRLHILHISTEKEIQLFSNMIPLEEKRITAEVCVHHLHFTSDDYAEKGNLIKCNPAIKSPNNREALWQALLSDRLDVIATDHAPHLYNEKNGSYEDAHAGLPLVQHSLQLMLHYVQQKQISIEDVVRKMCHAPAVCFQVKERGFIREGYKADVVLVNLDAPTVVAKSNLLYCCGWSPLEGTTFNSRIEQTFVNGNLVYENGRFNESVKGERLMFNR